MTRMSNHFAYRQAIAVCLTVCLAGSLAATAGADDQTRIVDGHRSAQAATDGPARQNAAGESPRQVILYVKLVEVKSDELRTLEAAAHVFRESNDRDQPGRSAGVTGVLENEQVSRLLDWLNRDKAARVLSAPTLAVVSGHTASFRTGGESPADTTDSATEPIGNPDSNRQPGWSLCARPEVFDSGLITLRLQPEFNNPAGTLGGIGSRSFTTFQLREGQSVVLRSPAPNAQVARVPFLGELPVIGATLRQRRGRKDDDTAEVLVVVTPELVKPMNPDDVSPLPGFYVTAPNDIELYSISRSPNSNNRFLGYDNQQPVAAQPAEHQRSDDDQYFPAGPRFPQTRPAAQSVPWQNIDTTPEHAPIQHAGHSGMGRWVQRPVGTAPLPPSANDCPQTNPASGLRPDHSPYRPDWWHRDSSTERLGHLHTALAALQAAGLTEQVKAVEREITKEQLTQKEREADALQQQIQLLRRTLGVPAPLPETALPAATD